MNDMSTLTWLSLKQIESLTVFSAAEISITLYSHMLFKRCSCTIFRGLYIGYLKLRTSVDAIHVVVQENCPNVLPHVKIRDNPNVSRLGIIHCVLLLRHSVILASNQ